MVTIKTKNSSLTLFPEFAARITKLIFNGENIIDGDKNLNEMRENIWQKSSLLIPFPNRTNNGKYSFKGKNYEMPINFPSQRHAIHGFIYNSVFDIVKEKEGKNKSEIVLVNHFEGREYFPWRFSTKIKFTLNKKSLKVDIAIKNNSKKIMPLGVGWHPYFKLGGKTDDWKLKIPKCKKIITNPRQIPTGEKVKYKFDHVIEDSFFDTGFKLRKRTNKTILSKDKKKITLWQDKKFPYLQVFIPPKRESIAIEPMTCNSDALNNKEGLINLRKEWQGSFGVKINY